MKLSQSFEIGRPPEEVWRALRDLPMVADCMPGAELTEHEGDRFKGKINIRLGPIAASFLGEGQTDWRDEERAGTVSGRGRDGKTSSQVQAKMDFAVAEGAQPGRSRVAVDVDFSLSGSLAQFGRSGIVNDLANRITGEFARNFEERLGGQGDAESQAAATEAPSDGAGRSAPAEERRAPKEIHAGGLFWSVLRERIAGFFRRLFGGG